jgi:ferredoxin-NADP reductase
MTDMARSGRPWQGETTLIGSEMLLGRLSYLHGPIYYMAGPPGMVVAMRAVLLGAGIDEDDVRAEAFAGY